jgi:hypothetical protein
MSSTSSPRDIIADLPSNSHASHLRSQITNSPGHLLLAVHHYLQTSHDLTLRGIRICWPCTFRKCKSIHQIQQLIYVAVRLSSIYF